MIRFIVDFRAEALRFAIGVGDGADLVEAELDAAADVGFYEHAPV